jgi:myo-inositol-1(or 4)-monophosphatase
VTPETLVDAFGDVATAVRRAVAGIAPEDLRARTDRPGQYALDLVADAVALELLHKLPVAVVSEESGASGAADAAITVVMDPVDGSTNCSRRLPYWAISLSALDADGPLASLVTNQATGVTTTAIRGQGAFRDGVRISASPVTEVEKSVVTLSGTPLHPLAWKQHRTMGCCALALVDVAAGNVDAYVDAGRWHAPWDYLGGVHACIEAGATVTAVSDEDLFVVDFDARRQLLAAGTATLLAALRPALTP